MPLFFAGLGAVGIYFIWQPAVTGPVTNQPTQSTNRWAHIGGMIFFAIFLGAGIFAAFPLLIGPGQLYFRARSWVAAPCEIVSSRVRSYSGDDTTHAPEIVYRYNFHDQDYTAARYKFYSASSSGYRGKLDTVRAWPPGLAATCFVDPGDPANAVLDRRASPLMLFGLVPLIFATVGLVGMSKMFRNRTSRESSVFSPTRLGGGTSQVAADFPEEWRVPAVSRRARAGGSIFFALLWNSIIGFIGYTMYRDYARNGSYGGLLFLSPFLLAGIFLVFRAWRDAASVRSPVPRIRLTPSTGVPGEILCIEWEVQGKTERLESIQLSLVAEESATYSRGTTSSTDKRVFFQTLLSPGETVGAGRRTRVTIPAGSMHSFAAQHNRVLWSVRAVTKVRYRPSMQDDFEVLVQPQRRASDHV